MITPCAFSFISSSVYSPSTCPASLSPDVNNPGFRNVSFDELKDTYYEATRALIEGGSDIILIETIFDINGFGLLGLTAIFDRDYPVVMGVVFLSSLLLLMQLAQRFEQQGHGTLAVISSVAGDRGRQSNYVYGAAKGMLSIFLQGLRNRLQRHGVQVLTIKPGFVDTPMTAAFRKGLLWAQPETVAHGILKAINRGADVVYLPWFWLPVMLAIRLLPETMFKRLRL